MGSHLPFVLCHLGKGGDSGAHIAPDSCALGRLSCGQFYELMLLKRHQRAFDGLSEIASLLGHSQRNGKAQATGLNQRADGYRARSSGFQ